jgi:hypothetical protein
MLSALILYSIDNTINEHGAAGGMRIGCRNLSTQRQPSGCRYPHLHKGIVSTVTNLQNIFFPSQHSDFYKLQFSFCYV